MGLGGRRRKALDFGTQMSMNGICLGFESWQPRRAPGQHLRQPVQFSGFSIVHTIFRQLGILEFGLLQSGNGVSKDSILRGVAPGCQRVLEAPALHPCNCRSHGREPVPSSVAQSIRLSAA